MAIQNRFAEKPEPRARNQRGVALLATLFAVALITILVVDFMYSATAAERAAANQANSLRAYYLARSAVEVGIALLVQGARQAALVNAPQVDSFQSLWAMPYPPLPLAGGWATVSIIDDARKIDVNQLVAANGQVNPQYFQIIEQLLLNTGVSPDVLPALIDWLDPDSVPVQDGAEASYYMQLMPPYMPRNGPMPTIGDLRMVRGVNEIVFNQLRNFLTAAPTTQVNINTAPPQVLAAVAPQLAQNPQALQTLLQARIEQPLSDPSQIANIPGLSNLSSPLPALFTTRSDYFTITGIGSFAGARAYVYATVRRNGIGPALLLSWDED
jgi:general secretion pathway protein K